MNNNLISVSPKDLKENVIRLFAEDWSLITAGDENAFNTMTASWGGMGELWGKDVCFIFVRPQRYTFEFLEENDLFTVSFYGKEFKKALSFCGAHSGRDVDKVKETGLTPLFLNGTTTFEEAKITLVCKKIAFADMKKEDFLDPSINKNYGEDDLHRVYVGEIIECAVRN